jgi:hypothetical protein
MIPFYKPNARNTGSACSFAYKPNDGSFFVSFIKQAGWDGKNGSFQANRNNPAASANVKLNAIEVAGIVSAIERGTDFDTVHTSQNQTVQIFFGRYINQKGEQVPGFSFRVIKNSNETKTSYVMGLTINEGRLLREFLVTALQEWSRSKIYFEPQKPQAETAPNTEAQDAPQEEVPSDDTPVEGQSTGDDQPW